MATEASIGLVLPHYQEALQVWSPQRFLKGKMQCHIHIGMKDK